MCNSNGKQTQLLSVFVFVIEHSGKFINHWNLNKFRNIYITLHFILLFLTCTSPYLFSDLVKFDRPYIHISIEHSVVKFSESPTVPEGRDNTTFRLCSVSPHDFLKFNCTALLMRSSTYVLFILPQLS